MDIKLHFKLCLFLILSTITVQGQIITNYSLSSSQSVYFGLTNPTTPQLTGGNFDEGWYSNIPIGFEFWYMGFLINNVHASTNGVLSLSQNAAATAASNNNLAAYAGTFYRPFLAPLWDNLDMDTVSAAAFSYQTSGTAPFRVFTAEWKNAEWNWFANSATISFQVKLYESTGVIEYIYNQEAGSLFSPSASIGIGGAANTQFLSLNNSTTAPTVSSTVSTNSINTKPVSGQLYSFTPPTPNNVGALTFSSINPTNLTVNWANVTGVVKYAVYVSTDNVNFIYAGNSTVNSLLVTGLIPSTAYYFNVYSISEGAYSTIPATGFSTTQAGAIAGTISVPSMVPTITSVLDSIKNYGIGGAVIIELEQGYSPFAERFPIYLSDTLGTSALAPLTIRPASGVTNIEVYTNFASMNAIFTFLGAKHVTIDGRPGGFGADRALTIRANNFVSSVYLNSYNNSQNNIELKYINFKALTGAPAVDNYIELYSYNGSSINSININNCAIGDSNVMANSAVRAYVYNQGSSHNNSIKDNQIFNTGNNYSSNSIYIYGTSNNTWHIERNHIYNLMPLSSASTTLSYGGISVQGASAHIKNNFIGGSDTACGGYAFEVGPANSNNIFYGIYYAGTNNQFVSIQGNKIANFFWPSVSPTPFQAIYIQSGNAYIGDTIGNIIGEINSNSTSIYVLSQHNANTATAFGIRSVSTAKVVVNNNAIAGFMATGVNSTYPCAINGINIANASQTNIENNTIGHLLFANSVQAASVNGFYPQNATGIQATSTGFGTSVIKNNTISNLSNFGTSTSNANHTTGIYVSGNLASTISNNNINNLYSASGNPSSNNLTSVSGIYFNTASGSGAINNNTIFGLRTGSTIAPAANYGINVTSTSGNTINVDGNFVHSLTTASSSILANICGLYLQEGIVNVTNNMIRLGIDKNGQSHSLSNQIWGINKVTNYNTAIMHNSVYIGGTVSGTTTINTYAFKKSTDGYDELKNNIFVNMRSNATSGGKHFAIGLNSANNTFSNNNLVLAAGNNGKLFQLGNVDYNTRYAWFNATALDDNSDSAEVYYINPTGNASAVNLHINPSNPTKAEGNGANTFVLNDFDGQLRAGFTPNDIGADAGDFIKIAINPVPVDWLWIKGERINNDVKLTWKVGTQLNNKRYLVERSLDGNNFKIIKTIAGEGTLYQPIEYKISDNEIFNDQIDVLYYRVSQVDYSGKQSHSNTVSILNNKLLKQAPITWPVPAKDKLFVKLSTNEVGSNVTFRITDLNGVEALNVKTAYQEINEINLKNLLKGIYFLSIQIDNGIPVNKKIIVL